MLNILWIDDAAVTQQDALLLAIKADAVPFFHDGVARQVTIQ